MTGNLRTHREIAEAVADDVASGDSDEYTLPYLMAGMIHGILALVDVMEDLQETLIDGKAP
jgi:hypothetical protein